jgi:hypothetical protein
MNGMTLQNFNNNVPPTGVILWLLNIRCRANHKPFISAGNRQYETTFLPTDRLYLLGNDPSLYLQDLEGTIAIQAWVLG